MVVFFYLLFALLVGWFGRNRLIGFPGWFVAGLLLTPPISAMILLFTQSARKA
ncbi:MAG: hypothetical protein H7Z12_15660 [Rhodospirillaceae bacterium]|nr:hypothetical protein [Rhodospirillales bacterium]